MFKLLFCMLILIMHREWYLYTSTELNFSILFPVKPEYQKKTISTELNEIQQTTIFIPAETFDYPEFQVVYSEYPTDFIINENTDTIKSIIEGTVIQELSSVLNGKLIYNSTGEIQGIPCRWFLMRFDQTYSLKCCIIWHDSNLISLMHYSKFDQRLSPRGERFFESFRLLKNH